jgi:hypothetical protein
VSKKRPAPGEEEPRLARPALAAANLRGPVRYPKGDAGELFKLTDEAAKRVMSDLDVWAEEADRANVEPLPWPLVHVEAGAAEAEFHRLFAEAAVNTLMQMVVAYVGAAPPRDAANAEFQVVLRIAKRATDAAHAAAVSRFGGTGRLSTRRALNTWLDARAAEAAIVAGGKRDDAFAAVGLSRAAAYRALKRGRP